MNLNLAGRTAVVTGGRHGILGPIISESLMSMGAKIIYLDLPCFDIGKTEDIDTFCNIIKSNKYPFYIPDIIVHNAAIDPKPGTDNGSDPFRRHAEIMKVNHEGVSYLNSSLIPSMISSGGGLIVIIGSIMGYISANPDNYQEGWTKAFGYNESKAALQMHCHGINTVFGEHGIRCVMPSFGPYEQGLSPAFMEGFGKKIPVQHPVSKDDFVSTLKYCIECESVAGEFRVDGGYSRIGR